MKCPHCQTELPSQECPECGQKIPLLGKFCCHCGVSIEKPDGATPNVAGGAESDSDEIDISKRTLCSDGTCIGVINQDGVCNECGKPYTGEVE